jgi:hypothetical protein
VESEKSYCGTPVPPYSGSFAVGIRLFKNLRFNVLTEWATGFSLCNGTKQWAIFINTVMGVGANNKRYRELEDLLGLGDWYEDVAPLTVGSDGYRKAADEYAKMDYNFMSNFIERADYFKIREISLSVGLGKMLPKVFGIQAVSDVVLGISARNLWTLTKYSGADVEAKFWQDRLMVGQEFFTLMQPRVYDVWLRVSL